MAQTETTAVNNLSIRKAEFNSDVSSTLRKGGQVDFALLLAMMQQDVTQRLALKEAEEEQAPVGLIPIEQFNFYPEVPLSAKPEHYKIQSEFANAVNKNDLKTAHLLACMHPTPLSLNNDAKKIPDEVIANCEVHTQLRMMKAISETVDVDETMLYEQIKQTQEMGLAAI
ncbi:MAG: hypothetical protein GJ680_03260 [Alteromonadaceae bacterium]|nr:hypothetical protein [Alteromonadaceae bacterium]